MKRIIAISTVTASMLFGFSMPINSGWNLVGAVSDTDPSETPCIKTAWTYSQAGEWKLYTNSSYGYSTPDTYGYTPVKNIRAGEGFWVNADTSCNITFDDNTSTAVGGLSPFNLFGFRWEDVKTDKRYTVPGNMVTNDIVNNKVALETVKVDNENSRTEIKTYLSSITDQAHAKVRVTNTSTGWNKLRFRTSSNVTIPAGSIPGLDSNATNVKSYCMIQFSGKKMIAKIYLEDNSGNDVMVYSSEDSSYGGTDEYAMYYNPNSSDLINKDINLHIVNDAQSNSVTFSADTGGLTIGSVSFTRPTGVTTHGIYSVMVRTTIGDDYAGIDDAEAGNYIRAEVYSVEVGDAQQYQSGVDMNTSTAATLSWNNFSTGLNTGDDDNWYGNFTKNDLNKTITIADNDYYDGQWNTHNSKEIGYTINSDTNLSVVGSDGFEGDIIIKGTQKVDDINGTLYNDLYVTDMEFHVTASGSGWTYDWDWMKNPQDNNGTPITNRTEFISFLTSANGWRVMDGFLDANGEIVEAIPTGTNYTGCTEGDCERYTRGINTIGTWYIDQNTSAGEFMLDFPNKEIILNFIGSGTTEDPYTVQEMGYDKVGAVWHEKLFTGGDATDTLMQNILSY